MKGFVMRVNWKIVSGVLAVAVTWDEVALVINKKRIEQVKTERDAYKKMTHYFAKAMDEHQVPFTEFDRIATETIMEKIKTQ